MRTVLEKLAELLIVCYRKKPAYFSERSNREMVLYPAAEAKRVEAFSAAHKMLPPSYGEFLKSADGVDFGWECYSLMGTRPEQRERVEALIAKAVGFHEGSYLYHLGGKTDKASVKALEKNPKILYPPAHLIVGASPILGLLVYDTKTRQKSGEMDLCVCGTVSVQKRFPSIAAYFEAALTETQEFYDRYIARKARKKSK